MIVFAEVLRIKGEQEEERSSERKDDQSKKGSTSAGRTVVETKNDSKPGRRRSAPSKHI
jgi:hypothetical protein